MNADFRLHDEKRGFAVCFVRIVVIIIIAFGPFREGDTAGPDEYSA
jgi:hypothetical protein